MNYNDLAEVLVANEYSTRQAGKTTALIEASIKIKGIFVACCEEMAKALQEKHPKANIVGPNYKPLRGTREPLIFDHYLLSLMLIDRSTSITAHQSTNYLKVLLLEIKDELIKREIYDKNLFFGRRDRLETQNI